MTKHELYPIAEYCIRKGLKNTKDGIWSIPLQEIKKVFGSTYIGSKEQNEEIYRELMTREEINELIMTEDSIEMAYHLRFCPECQQGGLAGAVSLLSVLGCNVSDEHEEERLTPSSFRTISYSDFEIAMAKHILWTHTGEYEQADFSNSWIDQKWFNHRNLINIHCENTIFTNVNFEDADLSYSTFRNCVFKNCNLRGLSVECIDFSGSHFINCDLSDSRFDECNFTGADLSESEGFVKLDSCNIKDTEFGDFEDNIDYYNCFERDESVGESCEQTMSM